MRWLRRLLIMTIALCRPIHAEVLITANCGTPVVIGEPHIMTCSIEGTLSHSVIWKRSKVDIIECDQKGKCYKPTDFEERYEFLLDNHPPNIQQFIIRKVQYDDLNRNWTCSDGMVINDHSSSSCKLTLKKWATTLAECPKRAMVGYSSVFTCHILGKIQNGIHIYRGLKCIAKCDENHMCLQIDDRYKIFNSKLTQNLQVIIQNVTEDDLKSVFTCVDSLVIPPSLPETSTCRITRAFDTTTKVGCKSSIGESPYIICEIRGKLAYGITIFRGNVGVLRCSPSFECYRVYPLRYVELINQTMVKLLIFNSSPDDYAQQWTCVDSPELPLVTPPEASCSLIQATTVMTTTTTTTTNGYTSSTEMNIIREIATGASITQPGMLIFIMSMVHYYVWVIS